MGGVPSWVAGVQSDKLFVTLSTAEAQLVVGPGAVVGLLALFQVVGAASQSTDEEEDMSLTVSNDVDLIIISTGICFIHARALAQVC